ncbi:MAG: hypothetical protein ACXV98_04710 [Ilumatobacteraceae bacterium]
MSSTTYAPQLALVAVGARPCDGLGHGYKWRAAAVSFDMNLNFMTETAIKHSARHLGKQPT